MSIHLNRQILFQNAKNSHFQTLQRAHPVLFAVASFSQEELADMDPDLPQWVFDEIRACSNDEYMRILLIRAGIEPNPGPGLFDRALKIRSKKRVTRRKPVARGQIPLNRARQTPNRKLSVRGSDQDVYISKREYVGQFAATTTGFGLMGVSAATPGYDGNPNCASLFPWLSAVAGAFEKYTFSKLEFELKGAAAATVGGNFLAAWDYDYDDAPSANSLQLLSNKSSIRCSPFETARLSLDTKRMNMDMPSRYVLRPGRVGPEARTTYCGYLMLASEGVPVGTSVALYINYTVRLMIPCLENNQLQTFLTTTTGDPSTTLYRLMPLGSISPGPMTLVTPGVNNVPPVIIPSVGAPLTMINLGNASQGIMNLSSVDVVTGVTPSTLAPGTYIDAAAIDRNGSVLGYVSTISPAGTRTCGASVQTEWSTASAPIASLLDIALTNLKSSYPTVAYLAPFVARAVAWGAGTKLWTMNYQV